MEKLRKWGWIPAVAALSVLFAFVVAFLVTTKAGIAHFALVTVVFCLFFALAIFCFVYFRKKEPSKEVRVVGFVLYGLTLIGTVAATVLMKVFVLFQPLSCNSLAESLFFAGMYCVLVAVPIAYIAQPKKSFSFIAAALAFIVFVGCLGWTFGQGYAVFYNTERVTYVFQGDTDGYDTYRIPSLVKMDKTVLKEKLGIEVAQDVFVAMAEARRDSSADEGKIDLVMKLSFDLGKSWTNITVLKGYQGDVKGKYGNPTPIFDRETAELHLVYIDGNETNGYKYTTYYTKGTLQKNLTVAWTEPELFIHGKKIIPGPSKGTALSSGRLIVPCYSGKYAFVCYSDDHGKTWVRGNNIAEGNECDVTELSDGRLLMVIRHNDSCAGLHSEQYQRYFISENNGLSWSEEIQSPLKTPICQSSVYADGATLYQSYPNDFYTRADMSLAISQDNGRTFEVKKLYDGPAAYSCITVSDGKVYVMAEIGKVQYCEDIVLIAVK